MATAIEWTDETWNPVTGCTKVSPGCANCYAERVTERFGRQKFTDIVLHPDRLEAPLHWRKPRRVFVNSMSDLFHEDIPDEFISAVFCVMAASPQHQFQVLTKRAARMRDYLVAIGGSGDSPWITFNDAAVSYGLSGPGEAPGPLEDSVWWPVPNVWLGVSCEDQKRANERIPILLNTPAAVWFVSLEPLLDEINLRCLPRLQAPRIGEWFDGLRKSTLDGRASPHVMWVIVGGESGPKARPMDLAWARSIVQQCGAAGVPCFVKQLGHRVFDVGRVPYPRTDGGTAILAGTSTLTLRDRKGGDPSEWPEDLRVRQFPKEN